MNDAIRCPGCEVHLLLPALPAGQTVACPRCQRVFEPARQRTSAAPTSVSRPRTPTPVDRPSDEPVFIPPRGRPELPRGKWRGYIAMSLLAVSSLAFAVQAYSEIELILLIHAQEALGAPRKTPLARMLEDVGGFRRRLRPAPAPDPKQVLLNERWQRWEEFTPSANIFLHVAFWPALLLLFIWLYRAHKNLPGLNAQGLSFTPAWAFISFLVPVFNLFAPFAFIQEIWRASHPNAIDTAQAWRDSPFARSVRVWWLFYAAAIVLWLVAFFLRPNSPGSYDQLEISACFGAAASLCSAGAGVMLIYLIRKITHRQLERYCHL